MPRIPWDGLRDGFRALGRSTQRRFLRRHHHASTENEVVDALDWSLAGSRQAQAASFPVTLAQSCSLKAVADAVAHAALPPEGLDGPGAPVELQVARGCTGTPVHLAALALLPGFQPCGLDELVRPSFACEIQGGRLGLVGLGLFPFRLSKLGMPPFRSEWPPLEGPGDRNLTGDRRGTLISIPFPRLSLTVLGVKKHQSVSTRKPFSHAGD